MQISKSKMKAFCKQHNYISSVQKDKLCKTSYLCLKRSLDIALSLIGIICLSPLFLIIACVIYVDSGGPVLFIHKRVGKNASPLELYKFRTMVADAHNLQSHFTPEQHKEFEQKYKLEKDPRITKTGYFLRKTHLDELPQIWNILKGDLSIVGPRPVVTAELEKYGENKTKFLSVTPGLTGYWQINGSSASYEERIQMELYYVENCSCQFDMLILLQTMTAIFKSRNIISQK